MGRKLLTIRIRELALLIRKRHFFIKQLPVGILLLLIFVILLISILASPTLAQLWSEGTTMPTARSEISATSIGDDIYVIGGFDA